MKVKTDILGEYTDMGFSLVEIADDFLELYFKDKKIATYNQILATEEIIQEGCKNYVASLVRQA